MTDFKFLDSLHPGDILVVSGSGIISTGIKWATQSEWTHVAIYVGGGSQNIIEAVAGGVEIHEVVRIYEEHTEIMVRRLTGLTVDQVELIKDAAYTMLNDPYDWRQIISMGAYNLFRKIGIKLPWLVKCHDGEKICTEVVCGAFAAIGIKFGADEDLVSPGDIATAPNLVTVYQGPL